MKGMEASTVMMALILAVLTIGVAVGVIAYTNSQYRENSDKNSCNAEFRTYCVQKYQLDQGGSWPYNAEDPNYNCVKPSEEKDRCKKLLCPGDLFENCPVK